MCFVNGRIGFRLDVNIAVAVGVVSMSKSHLRAVQVGIVAGLIGINAIAEEKNFGTLAPKESEIIEHLKQPAADAQPADSSDDYQDVSQDALKNVRGLKRINSVDKATGKKVTLPTTVAEQAISLQVLFNYNSATLSDQAKVQLDPVGKALASGELKDLKFRIEGHTDAVGSDDYNVDLSRRRAEAVKAFLVEKYALSASAIEIEGVGKSGLADPSNPGSEVNRRVRIVSVSR
jgi:outer membrane protein OmpA-like peptidoglycan-associated protein